MADAFASVNGHGISRAVLNVSYEGPWFADVVLGDDAPELVSGPVVFKIGTAELKGTLTADHNGTFGLLRSIRIVAGGAGWRKLVGSKPYHNDANVKASLVVSDLAAEVGETIGTAPTNKLDTNYLREAGAASRVIEDAARGVPWWVDYSGVTHVASRASANANPDLYEVLEHDPLDNELKLSVDEVTALQPGYIISERVDVPLTIRSIEFLIDARSVRAIAWCGVGRYNRIENALRGAISRLGDQRLFGKWRYRVVSISGDRADLQIVRKGTGLPDAVSIRQYPGAAGAFAKLAGGDEVVVEFLEGDRSLARITGFAVDDSPAPEAARKGDTVRILLPPMVFTGTIGGSPATGVLAAMTGSTLGTIETGSSKLGIQS
jgi:hypothetical protein